MGRVESGVDIGERIRKARKARGLSAAALAAKVGTDKGTISRIERGEAGLSVKRLQQIAHALDMEPATLLGPAKGRRPAPRRIAARAVAPSPDDQRLR